MDVNEIIAEMTTAYGEGSDAPSRRQWEALLALPRETPVTLINFFRFREKADYGDESVQKSGEEAFNDYAAVSVPTLEKVGGSFRIIAPFAASLIGPDEDWSLSVMASYPDIDAVLALFRDDSYREAYRHRAAACADQRVSIAFG